MDARISAVDVAPQPRSDWTYLLLLLVLAMPLKVWLLYNTEVTARDSVGYIRYALQFEKMPWDEVLSKNLQHPGYSFFLWLVSIPVRSWHGGVDPEIMRVAAQLTTAIFSLLMLIPMFGLGKALLGSRIAFWGTLLFQFLPVCAHTFCDGVSEGVFYFFVTASLWQSVLAFQRGAWIHFALAGVCAGMSYLTRPEGAFLLAAPALLLVGRQLLPSSRQPWRRWLWQGASLAIPAVALGSLYVLATGKLTNKPSPRQTLGLDAVAQSVHTPDEKPRGVAAGPLFAATFAAFFDPGDDNTTRLRRGALTLGAEVMQCLHYAGVLGLVLGLLLYGRELTRRPGLGVLLIYLTLQCLAVLALAMRVAYISERHVIALVIPASYLMAAGFLQAGQWLRAVLGKRAHSLPVALSFVLGMTIACLPKSLERLHANRRGNLEAGLWLRGQVKEGDLVLDDHAWSHYYTGQVFREGNPPLLPAGYRPTSFVVMTRSRVKHIDEERRALEQKLLESQARVVYRWPPQATDEAARVVVYAMPRNFAEHPWQIAD